MFNLLKRFKWYYWIFIIIIVGLTYIQVTTDLEIPDRLSKILALSYETVPNKKELIKDNGIAMLLYAGVSTICGIITGLLSVKIATGFAHDVRRDIYKKVSMFSVEEMDKFQTASLITRSTNDVTQVQIVVLMSLRLAISAPLQAIKGILKAANKATDMSFILIVSVVTLVFLILLIFLIVMPKFKKLQTLTDKLNLVTRENLTGLRVTRAYNAVDIQKDKFNIVNTDVKKTNIFVNRVLNLINPFIMMIMNGTSLAIMWLGAYFINDKKIMTADVFAFQQYAMMIIMSFMMLSMLCIMLPRSAVSGKRINEILKESSNIKDCDNPITKAPSSFDLEFKNVCFMYPDSNEMILDNISFKIEEGKTTAFIGSTGSGKSTLINLIPRFFDCTNGDILLSGVSIKKYSISLLRDIIGYVPQKAVLFSGTIRSNLMYGKNDANEEEMYKALEIAQAKDFVSSFEHKLDSMISQGGKNVSGGQKQRLSIARAIIKKPNIYIFDDSFSALDFKTDKKVREALKEETKGATTIIVAQRIGTIMNADQIIVLDEGKIVGIGSHKELLNSCDVYKEIALSQLSKEELV